MLDQRHVSCEKPGEGRMARGQEAAPLEVMWYKAWGLTEGKGWKKLHLYFDTEKDLKTFHACVQNSSDFPGIPSAVLYIK